MAKVEFKNVADGTFRVAEGTEGALNVNVVSGGSTAAGVTPTNRSGTITAGGTAQQLAASNSSRKGYWIQNVSTGDLWINTIATAVVGQPSLRIAPGDYYETPISGVPTGAISIIGATTSQAFSAREW